MKIDIGLIVTAINNTFSGLSGVTNNLNSVGAAARNTEQRLRAIQVVLAGIAVAQVQDLARKFLDTASNLEKMRFQLTLSVGEQAQGLIEDFRETFKHVDMDVEKLIGTFTRFTQIGMPIERAKELTKVIGDMSLASGKGKEAAETMGIALAKIFAMNKIEMRALGKTMLTAMPDVLQNVAAGSEGRFKTTAAVLDAIGTDVLTVDKLITMMVTGSNKRLAGMREALANSLGGAIDGIRDAWVESVDVITRNTPVKAELVTRLRAVRQEIDNFVDAIRVEHVKQFFDLLDNIVTAAFNLAKALTPVVTLLAQFASQVSALIAGLPTEVVAAGVIGYIFYGRMGLTITTLVTGALSLLSRDTKNVTNLLVSYIEAALPFGIIGLMAAGKRGALYVIAAFAAFDIIATNLALKFGDKNAKARVAEHGTLLKSLESDMMSWIKTMGIADTTAKNTKFVPSFSSLGDTKDTLRMQDPLALEGAKRAREAFVRQLNEMDGQFKISNTNIEASTALMVKLKNTTDPGVVAALKALTGEAKTLDDEFNKQKGIIASQNNDWKELSKNYRDNTVATGDMRDQENAMANAMKEANAMRSDMKIALQAIATAEQTVAGNDLAAREEQITKAMEQRKKTITDIADKMKEFLDKQKPDAFPQMRQELEQINAIMNRNVSLADREIGLARDLHQIKSDQLLTEQQIARNRAEQSMLQLKQQYSNDTLYNIGSGTAGGQIVMQVQRERLQLSQQILQTEIEIGNLESKKLQTSDPALRASIDQTIGKYKELSGSAKSALQGLSAEAVSTRQLWQEVGNTLHNNIADGISGIITRTMTWQQVSTNLFNALTKAAVNYLLKLAEIQLFGSVMGGGGGGLGSLFGGGKGLLGGLFGAANGGVFPGGLKMFGNGGIIGGPTLFGMAGEAGTEAVMPLTNVNGKLGVNTSGSGGNTYHITIQAIDTQTGTEFLLQHMDTIVGGLSHKDKLNQGRRQVA